MHLLRGKSLLLTESNDEFAWKETTNGSFTTSSAIQVIGNKSLPLFSRRMIWSHKLPKKVSIFMWKLLNNALPLDDKLQTIRFSLASKYQFCTSEETFEHLFKDCSLVNEVWIFL
ncbi:hypothetical protein ACH5RR_009171 [Cinchona calisaya]|uniref:Reverse transcriptase zinc-binding domain-containing protein n=1 Tax=Cinchona calisaya TaxID=153742 RepID=A0ABD3AF76_9GENT